MGAYTQCPHIISLVETGLGRRALDYMFCCIEPWENVILWRMLRCAVSFSFKY